MEKKCFRAAEITLKSYFSWIYNQKRDGKDFILVEREKV